MKRHPFSFRLLAGALALLAGACEKQGPDSPEKPAASPSESSSSDANTALAYRELIEITMGPLDMEIPMADSDPIKGRVTMTRQFIADVTHPTDRRKKVTIRRYLGQKIGEIFGHDIPRQTTGEDSPLTSMTVVADRTSEGWKYSLPQGTADEAQQTDLDGLNRMAAGEALFYARRAFDEKAFWNVPLEGFSRWMGKDAILLAGDIGVQVDRFETVENEPCVILDVSLQAEGKLRDEEGKTLNMTTTAKGKITRSLERQIDIQVQIEGTIDFHADIPEQNTSMTMTGPITIVETRLLQ